MAEKLVGNRFSRFVGVFMAAVYYPSLVSVLSYLTAKYTLLVFGSDNVFLCTATAVVFLVTAFLQNTFLPAFAKRVQLATTFIKLVPLILMIVLGITRGVLHGTLHENMIAESNIPIKKAFFPSVTATLFAYEGWISVLGVGKNLKNSRRNLPLALVTGGAIISAVYVLYYLGICFYFGCSICYMIK
jgi:APA family basic amino acid/polyamine antiporter